MIEKNNMVITARGAQVKGLREKRAVFQLFGPDPVCTGVGK